MKKKIVTIAGFALSVFNLLMFFSMRPCWSGISKTLNYEKNASSFVLNLPIYLCVLFFLIALSNLLFLFFSKKKKIWPIVYLVLGIIFFAAVIVIIKLGASDYMRFIWPNFFDSLLALDGVLVLGFFLFVYPKSKLRLSKLFKCVVLFLAIFAMVLGLTKFSTNKILEGSVVYAVEDEYQIVFSSKADSTAWVTIDGQDYYDLYSGSMNAGKIHKIIVPMEVLDSARSYEIHVQKIIYRGPFGGILGKTISEKYAFKPVDTSDGLSYFCFSDIHMRKAAAIKTEKKLADYDFFVIGGDFVSMVDSFEDANYCNELCYEMTKGEIPVIYSRGNHEVKGKYAPELYKYVGSKNENFFYNVLFNDVYVAVLDLGEDHDDDWWEYYGTAKYDLYRLEQEEFLKKEIANNSFSYAKYKLVVAHIPLVYVNYRHNHEDIKASLTALVNEMNVDMHVCGHQHEVLVFEPGLVKPNEKLKYNPSYAKGTYSGYLTDFNFPCLMISKPGYSQSEEDDSSDSMIGLLISVDFDADTQKAVYYNSNNEKINVVNPFFEKDYGNEIDIDLKTKEMK